MNTETNDLAMLAGMVKGNMRKIDSLMADRPDRPADNIDIRNFINEPRVETLPTITTNLPQQQVYVEQSAIHTPQPQISQITHHNDDQIKQDIESIKLTLEKINVNLTKLTGMFGKVFQSLTKGNKNG
jgi:hypothetical protein